MIALSGRFLTNRSCITLTADIHDSVHSLTFGRNDSARVIHIMAHYATVRFFIKHQHKHRIMINPR